jgi:DNA-directed RNA polymerase specialized sigma24 family protein
VARETIPKVLTRENLAREAMTHLDHLYRVASHLVKEPNDAQDLVQETYVRALGSCEQFTPGSSLGDQIRVRQALAKELKQDPAVLSKV